MKASFVSSSAMQNVLRLTISQSQNRLQQASTEATTGTYADIGVSLGVGAAKSINLTSAIAQAASFKTSNAVVELRMDASQTALSSLKDAGDSLVSNLTALQASQDTTSIAVALQTASATISQLVSTANTSVNGEFLFGGTNLDSQPLTDQSSAVSDTIVSALNDYATGLGKDVNALTGEEIGSFITDTVEPMFSENAWTDTSDGWSTASSSDMTSRISGSETITSSTNANSEGMRYLALASGVVSALFGQDLSSDAQSAVASKAIAYAAQATAGIVTQQSELGLSQERLEKANDALDAQSTLLQGNLVDLQGVDAYEASTLVNQLQTQLETAYTLVSKLQGLSLVNYL
ncbi:flagellar hook-associated family protein [Rhizobium leguminosarum]|uniref:flagellar hook-associated family protein n=1 Tax=Rhizobium leguminosarum TaxID=384 RepID=UPI001030551B|nr:flagellar hook-associated family protein [Rhizobium leguminosarum]TAV84893.1 flagellar hook-associated family protein [Rhizobium leguminosarum]TAV85836.1 flagellar hook-associated family protein [Rhizobium leguminosarum]TAW27599.1 flagellar hook-associated family protein [Rhizobium leguminosarum]TAX26009.1 flagellar hook-associated family protein [Rhizobium leguminosarum]TAY29489.1 flagellar hook-associated family protein [Rhizobium leguminosarum]